MRKLYNLLSILVFTLLLINATYASHLMGSDLVYRHVSGNTYLVIYKVYRDCSSNAQIGTPNLVVSRDTCGAALITRAMTLQSQSVGAPYCKQLAASNTCTTAGAPNYEEFVYNATVTLPGPHPRWTFSVSLNARPASRNLVTPNTYNLFSRATLNNTNNITNSSPSFNPFDVVVPFVCWNDEVTYSFNTIETDGDSLGYVFSRPFRACDQTVAFNTYDQIIYISPSGSGFAIIPAGNQSPSFPIPSFRIDSSTAPPWKSRRFFDLDQQTGSITFMPMQYYPTATSASGQNKYVVCVEIREYRDINGVKVLIGTVQRDLLFIVYDCGGNKLPKAPNATVPPQTNSRVLVDSITDIKAQTCNITIAKILYRDPNPQDTLNVSFPYTTLSDLTATGLIDSASLDSNRTSTPSLTIRIRPTRADIGKTYSFLSVIEDDGCPIKGIQRRIIRITVIDSNFGAAVNAIGLPQDTVCRGLVVQLNARTLRPDTLRGAPQSYTYVWDDAIGLDPADKNKKTLYVNPSRTTTYKVKIFSEGFPDCYDTASIEVKVRDSLKAGFDALYFQNSSGTALSNPVDISFKNTSTPRADIDSVKWSTYKVYRDGSAVSLELLDTLGTFERPVLNVTDGGEYRISVQVWTRVNNRYICPSIYSENVVVPSYLVPNIITPNGDGRNDVFTTQSVSDVNSLKLYNRWGELVRDYDTYNNDFDGTGLNSGIYFFILESKVGLPTQKGWLEIMK